MWWFKSRPRQRKFAQREMRLEAEQLESRFAAGSVWDPWTGIDITGIKPDTGIWVAGQVVEFSIVGTGEDLDKFTLDDGSSGGQDQDTVWITWWGASCEVFDEGRLARCQLGSAGAASAFHITMLANDEGLISYGDSGSRDDAAVEFSADVVGVWVTISARFTGAVDSDNPLRFFNYEPFTLPSDVASTGPMYPPFVGLPAGFFEKVELTGTVAPDVEVVRNGSGPFHWKQTLQDYECFLEWSGANGGGVATSQEEGIPFDLAGKPFSERQFTKNSKVFFIDAPGVWTHADPYSPNNPYHPVRLAQYFRYANFTSHVEFKTQRTSNDFEWYVGFFLQSDGNSWTSDSYVNFGEGHHDVPPPLWPGSSVLDCSNPPMP